MRIIVCVNKYYVLKARNMLLFLNEILLNKILSKYLKFLLKHLNLSPITLFWKKKKKKKKNYTSMSGFMNE